MYKHKKKQNGITLISLVISIIVMLILAGVTLNAAIGDNGIISQAQYATFLNEMAAVEEAVQLWKINQKESAIPANGLCQEATLSVDSNKNAERLNGEVGYYRVWSMTETMPTLSVLVDVETFNNNFGAEVVYYPAGAQDLYYLDNEGLGIDSKKEYIIDAVNSMVYSTTGITIKGVRVYSTAMAKAVMSGTIEAPLFAEAEVSGTGSNENLAGNVQEEYLPDGTKNPDYNPYGFQIIADTSNDNVYKLYNNGDLYGKGVKGPLLNSSEEEMAELDVSKWHEFTVPSEIPGYNTDNIQIISGNATMFIIDANKDLWAWGNNDYNKLGLSEEQQIDYTGREVIKLDIFGKQISKVYPLSKSTFVLTTSNELYACGYNTNGELGIGNTNTSQTAFSKVDFDNPQNISMITEAGRDAIYTMILTNNEDGNKVYFAGNTKSCTGVFKDTDLEETNVVKFIEILNNTYGTYPESKIVNIYRISAGDGYVFELENQKLYNFWGTFAELKFNEESANVNKVCIEETRGIILRTSNDGSLELWGYKATNENILGIEIELGKWTKMNDLLPNEMSVDKIKDMYIASSNVFYLMENGTVFASGTNLGVGNGLNTDYLLEISKVDNLPEIEEFICTEMNTISSTGCFMLLGVDGKKYVTGASEIIFRDNILQKNWKLIASNVKKFKAQTTNNCLAYIDRNNDLWVLGDESTILGINHTQSEKIPNFVRLKDYLKEQEIYNHLDGKIEDYYFTGGPVLFIKTNEEDSNTVYACGKLENNYWYKYSYSGLTEDAYVPTKIKDNVKIFNAKSLNRFILTYDNELYTWGANDGSSLGTAKSTSLVLNTNSNISYENISKIYPAGYQSYMLTNNVGSSNNILWVTGCGIGHTTACNGYGNTVSTWTAFDMSLFKNENIKDIVTANGQSEYVVLTEKGNLYGWGASSKLGIGSASSELNRTVIELTAVNNENLEIDQIVAGKGFFIFTTKDGKVYGTGSNQYGILGRWIGVDRNSPNSRYKTAFDWVECPELEI